MPNTTPVLTPSVQAALKIMYEATCAAEELAQIEHKPRGVYRYSRAKAVVSKWFNDYGIVEEGTPVIVTSDDETSLGIHPDKPPQQQRAI